MVSLPDGSQLMAYFGGRYYAPKKRHQKQTFIYKADMWLYNPVADSWTLAAPKGGIQPNGRDHHGATAIGSTLYIFGGRASASTSASALLGDLWSYSFATNTWKELSNLGRPTPGTRYQMGIASIPVGDSLFPDGAVALFAGGTAPASTKASSSNDVWVYPLAGWGWKKLSMSHCSRKYTGTMLAPPATIDSSDNELLFVAPSLIEMLPACAMAVAASALFLFILAARLCHTALRREVEDKSEKDRCYQSLEQ
jgi:hypothetical protein